MRTIKFRIYFEDEEPFMSEPITLEDLLHGEDIEFRNEDDTLSLPLNDFRFFYKRNQNYKIMQYTGLHDKNGKEIYENMIINNEYIVVYDFCKFVLKNIKNGNITDFKKDGVYEITREYFE